MSNDIDNAYDEGNKLLYQCHKNDDFTEFVKRIQKISDEVSLRTMLSWLIMANWVKHKIDRDVYIEYYNKVVEKSKKEGKFNQRVFDGLRPTEL